MATSNTSNSGAIGFFGLVTIAFIVLKLTHVINWSWWWVLSPALFVTGLFVLLLPLAIYVVWRKSR